MLKNLIKFWPYIFLLGLSTLIVWPIFLPGYFSHHDDLQVMRIFEMRKCLEDLQIPCRWVPDMGYGNGYPLFNYYNVLPYYIGGLVSYLLGFIGAAKFLFFIAVILAPITAYLLAKELFEDTYAALTAAILYMFAPYRALDIFVRGAIAESFALAIIPLIFYFLLKFLKQKSLKSFLGLALSLACLLTSHNIMTLLFAPLILAFFLIIVLLKRQTVRSLILALGLGFGLAAFFVLPAFFEKNLVQIDNLTRLDLDFRAHFVTVRQLFLDRQWGYGASSPGTDDTISFQIGLIHWLLVILSIPTLFILRKNIKLVLIYLGFLLFFIISIFMTHNKSAFVWESIGLLRFTQFPWRFLSVTIFTASILGGFLIFILKGILQKVIVAILIIAVSVLNWNYFQPREFYPDLTDKQKLSGNFWELQQKAAMLDYLPMGAIEPREASTGQPSIKEGKVEIEYFKNKSNSWELKIYVKETALVEFPVYDFPDWKVYIDGKEVNHSKDKYLGRISVNIDKGNHTVSGRFRNTSIRTVSNIISALSILIVLYLVFYAKSRRFLK